MFQEYFTSQAEHLASSLEEKLNKKTAGGAKKGKELKAFIDFYTFLKNHIPANFSISSGKVRNKKHLLNRSCDVLIYNKWVPKLLDMTGGYVLSETLYTVMSLERKLTDTSILNHAVLTNALKTLYTGDLDTPESQIIPMYSILFAYDSDATLRNLKQSLKESSLEKEIPLNRQVDMICVLNRGLIIKDWEEGGDYKVVETGKDTLMWFYILLLEYLDRDGKVGLDVREYINNGEEYKEY